MWYIFGHPWKNFSGQSEPDRIYKIAHAVSQDGIEWEKVIDYIARNVLQHPDRFDVLCVDCHADEHMEEK